MNFVRDVEVPAPRGEILDSSGQILASSRRAYAVEISPPNLPVPITDKNLAHPPQADALLYDRLAGVLGAADEASAVPGGRPRAAAHVRDRLPRRAGVRAAFLRRGHRRQRHHQPAALVHLRAPALVPGRDRPADLPADVPVRRPSPPRCSGSSAGSPAPRRSTPTTRASTRTTRSASPGSRPPTTATCAASTAPRRSRSTRSATSSACSRRPLRTAGDNLKLSLNANLEEVGQQALQQSIDTNYPANGGAFVAMNPDNGEIYAMGSLPTYNANVFTKPVPYSTYNSLFGPNSGDPQVNRAYQSAGPTGSTFKPITATAALESGAWSVGSIFDDTGQYCFSGQCRHNSGNAVDGSLNLVNAIKVSSDDFFYNLGRADQLARSERRPAPEVGARVRDRAEDRDRPARRDLGNPAGRRRGARTATSSRPSATTPPARSSTPTASRPGREAEGLASEPSIRRAAAGSPTGPTGRGRSATTRTWPSARATCRSRRSSSRSPTRRWPTAGRSSPRTSGSTSRAPTGPCCS